MLGCDTVLLSACSKYKDMCVNCSRTLLIDANSEQKEGYIFLTDLFYMI